MANDSAAKAAPETGSEAPQTPKKTTKGRRAYDPTFAQEVFDNVDSGEEIKLCMQCGVCSGSCPFKMDMKYSPRKLFTMIRSGERDRVLSSPDIMLCTSCYRCKVRCPRGIRVIDVMHGLAHYALEQGFEPRHDSAQFGRKFWDNIFKKGRIDEKDVAMRYTLADGLVPGIKKGLDMQDLGLKQVLHRRLNILPVRSIKGIKGLKKMLEKAAAAKHGRKA